MIRVDVHLLENNEWVDKTNEVIYPVVLNQTLDESLDDGAFTIYGTERKERYPAFTKCKIELSDVPRPLSALPVGTLVRDAKTTYLGAPIVWRIAAHNHPGYPVGSTTLISDRILTSHMVDGKEPSNADAERRLSGNSRWAHSNLRQWLNTSSPAPWWTAQHAADTAPTHANGVGGTFGYSLEDGFLSGFSVNFTDKLLDTTYSVTRSVIDGGGTEILTDKILLASTNEVAAFPIFANYADRRGYYTPEGAAYYNANKTTGLPAITTSESRSWWLRGSGLFPSPCLCVPASGGFGAFESTSANNGAVGVRPMCNLPSLVGMYATPDEDGVYNINFEPYSETRYYYANDTVEQTVFVQPYKYNHSIRLIEPTKILERYIISGMAVSQPIAPPRTIKYLDNVIDILFATNPTRRYGTPPTFFLDETLRSKLHKHKSPEYRWSCRMTLFECLHDVGRYIGAMPRLIPNPTDDRLFNTVSFDYFGRIENNIAELQYSSYTASQDENQYCTELETYAENMIEEDDNVMVYPAPGCWITARSDELAPTEENLYIPTPTPIERVVKVLVRNVRIQEIGAWGIIQKTMDITKFIVPEEEWLTLDIVNALSIGNEKAKNNTFYYRRGERNIGILTEKYKAFAFDYKVFDTLIGSTLTNDDGTLQEVQYVNQYGVLVPDAQVHAGEIQLNNNLKQWEFQIHYVPVVSAKIKAVKQL